MDILKLKWPLIIIILVEVIFLILYVLYEWDLIDLKTLTTLVVVEVAAGILGYFLGKQNERRQNKREEENETKRITREEESKQRKKTEQELKIHAKLLKPALQQFSTRLVLKNRLFVLPILNDRYSVEAESHLKYGYEETWKYKENRDSQIISYNSKFQDFSKTVTEKIINLSKQKNLSFGAWDMVHSDIEITVENSYTRTFDFDSSIFKNYSSLEMKQVIKGVLDEVLIKEEFKNLKTCYDDIWRNHNLFVNSIDMILKKIDNDKPLEGKCEPFGY